MNTTEKTIVAFCDALRADHYHVRLVNFVTQKAIPVDYDPEQLIRASAFLRLKNSQGFNIYCRPAGYQYVLLDDLRREVLGEVATIRPCALLETSPENYQAWVILPTSPNSREQAKAVCRELAETFGADLASAEPDHVGRLPGFTNRKEKHQQSNGLFPYVRLCRSEYRISTFYPRGGAVLIQETQSISSYQPKFKPKNSESERDFGIVCGLIRQGMSDEKIFQELLDKSYNLLARKGRHANSYIARTIQKARNRIK